MKLLNPDFLVIGLDNGIITGWNLSSNSFNNIEAHQGGAIMVIKMHGNYLITADRKGIIQIRDMTQGYALATQEIPTTDSSPGKPQPPNAIISLTVVETKGEFVIFAGHINGIVTAARVIDPQNIIISQFGAFNGKELNGRQRVQTIFPMKD